MPRLSKLEEFLTFAVSNSRRGGVSTLFAFALPVVLIVALGAVELTSLSSDRARLQDVADTAALNAASQMQLAPNAALLERTREFAATQGSGLTAKLDAPQVEFIVQSGALFGVEVMLTARRPSFFGNLMPLGGFVIQATGRAQKLARNPLCILSLSEAGTGTPVQAPVQGQDLGSLNVQEGAILARSCMVYSNHNIVLGSGGRIDAASVQAVDTISGQIANSGTGAARLEDPLSAIFANSTPGKCPNKKTRHKHEIGSDYVVPPGVFCGQLVAQPGSTLEFEPGVHHLKEGTLVIKDNVTIVGENVTLVIWPGWEIKWKGTAAALDLSGTTTGPWAGFALAVHPDYRGPLLLAFREIRQLEGVVYAPGSTIVVPGSGIDATQVTPWTVIVANALEVEGGRQLQINTNYEGSAVPVPDGVGNRVVGGVPVQLVR